MKAAGLLARSLEHEGARHIFGVPGEKTMDLLDALAEREQVRFIPTRL